MPRGGSRMARVGSGGSPPSDSRGCASPPGGCEAGGAREASRRRRSPRRARCCGAAPVPSRPAPPNGAAPAPGPPRPAPSRPDGRSAGPHGGAAGAVAAGGRAGGCGGTPASLPRSDPARRRRAPGSAAALRLPRPRPRCAVRGGLRGGSRGGAAVQPQPGGGGGRSGGAGPGFAVAVAVRGAAGARRGGGAGRAPIPPRAAPDRLLRRGAARSLRQRRRQRPRSAVPRSGECPSRRDPKGERSVPAPHPFSPLIPSRLLSSITPAPIPAPSHSDPCLPSSPSRLHPTPHPSPNLCPYPGSHLVSVPALTWPPSWRSQSGLLSLILDPIPPSSWLRPSPYHSFVPTQPHFPVQDSLGCVMSALSRATIQLQPCAPGGGFVPLPSLSCPPSGVRPRPRGAVIPFILSGAFELLHLL